MCCVRHFRLSTPDLSPGQDHYVDLCSWVRHFTLIVDTIQINAGRSTYSPVIGSTVASPLDRSVQ